MVNIFYQNDKKKLPLPVGISAEICIFANDKTKNKCVITNLN